MIRYGKRLNKKTIFDYVQCRDENRYTDFVLADMGRQLGEFQEELEAKDVELAQASEAKACGAYRIVHEDEYSRLVEDAKCNGVNESDWYKLVADYNKLLEAKDVRVADLCEVIEFKDAEIIDLKSDLEAVAHESEVRQAEIVRQRDWARSELRKVDRLQHKEATYDANAVNGFNEVTTDKFASLAQQALDRDRKISYSAACAVVLKRELDKARKQIKDLTSPVLVDVVFPHTAPTLGPKINWTRQPDGSWRGLTSVPIRDASGSPLTFDSCTHSNGK